MSVLTTRVLTHVVKNDQGVYSLEWRAANGSVFDPAYMHGLYGLSPDDPAFTETYAPLVETVNVVADSNATQIIPDPSATSVSTIVLTENCTLTSPPPISGKSFTVVLEQDATGSRTVTWSPSVKWAGGVPPVLSTSGGSVDYFTFVCTDGVTWAGFLAGLDIR
jgi:hypothetical protein